MRPLLTFAATLVLAASVPAHAQPMRDAQGGMATMAEAYLRMAAASDQFEILSSQMALDRSSRPAVRQFARRMVRDHHRSSALLMATPSNAMAPQTMAMMRDGMTVTLTEEQTAMLRELETREGAAFDRAYLRAQILAHEQAYALHTRYAETGSVPELRIRAAQIAEVVRGHLISARRLARGA